MIDQSEWQGDLRGKKLLILDGSRKAIEIIDHARKMGVYTIVTDYNDPDDSPAKLIADEYFDVSTVDVGGVADLIRKQRIDGVLPGFSDRWLPVYADICEAAGLPAYATREQLELFTNKRRYKRLMSKHGVPTIQDYSVEDALAGGIPAEDYPIIVKPSDGSGSRGITVCRTPVELLQGLEAALEYSKTSEVVIERFLPGREATVFWTFQDGLYCVSMLMNRHMLTFGGNQYRLPNGYTSPSTIIPEYLRDIAPRVRDMLSDVGIRDGVMFMQGLEMRGVFYAYDIGYRLTPTQEYRMMEVLQKYNPLSMLITFALTGSMGEEHLAEKANPHHPGYAYNVSILAMPARIGKITGLDEVRKLPSVLSVLEATAEGESLPPEGLGQLRQIVVRTIGAAETQDEMTQAIQRIGELIAIEDDHGKLISLPSLDAEAHVGRLMPSLPTGRLKE